MSYLKNENQAIMPPEGHGPSKSDSVGLLRDHNAKGDPAAAESAVENATVRLSSLLNSLGVAINNCEARFSPVLRPTPACNKGAESKPCSHSPLASDLEDLGDKAEGLLGRLREFLDRADV